MKHQYFGDINDFWTYGLLRHLQRQFDWSIAYFWLLTPDDESNDGRKIDYLLSPEKYRNYDPELFDFLKNAINSNNRHLNVYENSDMTSNSFFISDLLPQNFYDRKEYWLRHHQEIIDSDLIFFDPDNGISVPSVKKSSNNANKYLWIEELEHFKDLDSNLLIFQYFPRVKRESYLQKRVDELRVIFKNNRIFSFSQAHITFFLIENSKDKIIHFDQSIFTGNLRTH